MLASLHPFMKQGGVNLTLSFGGAIFERHLSVNSHDRIDGLIADHKIVL
jgi:hypothetical protein